MVFFNKNTDVPEPDEHSNEDYKTGFNCVLLSNQAREVTVKAGIVTGANEYTLHQLQLSSEVQGTTKNTHPVITRRWTLSLIIPTRMRPNSAWRSTLFLLIRETFRLTRNILNLSFEVSGSM